MKRILFLCIQNAGRSQMAEAFGQQAAGENVEVYSAGSNPGTEVHPLVVDAMQELGIDLSTKKPQGLNDLPDVVFDLVVGMGCGDVCPAHRAKEQLQWDIPNPKDQPLDEVRNIRDSLRAKVEALVSTLNS